MRKTRVGTWLQTTWPRLESTPGHQLFRNFSAFSGETPTTSACLAASKASQWRPTNLPSLLGYCGVTPLLYSCSSSLKHSWWGKVGQHYPALGSWDSLNDELINSMWETLRLCERKWT